MFFVGRAHHGGHEGVGRGYDSRTQPEAGSSEPTAIAPTVADPKHPLTLAVDIGGTGL